MDSQGFEEHCESQIDYHLKVIEGQQSEYDKQLLTLSSAMLGVSLAFIKDVVQLRNAELLFVLYASWAAFGICILGVVFSFQLSIRGQHNAIAYTGSSRLSTMVGGIIIPPRGWLRGMSR